MGGLGALLSGVVGLGVGAAGLWAAISAGLVNAPGSDAKTIRTGPMQAAAAESPTAPAYFIVLGDVYDREAFIPGYAQKMPPIYAKYNGEYLAVGRNKEVLEGDAQFSSYVISKWPSMDAARAFWNSPEYAPLKAARIDNNWGKFDVLLVEGAAAAAPPAE
ncbi:MAG: DUF1330 domain-containing protein [Pseudomonadota bacterium]